MKYSFLLSLYHKEKAEYLEACLLSLSKQTVQPEETIVVFDGPVGIELETVIKNWTEQLKIKVVRLEKNIGLGLALNKGLEACSNDIVARVDTDDIYKKNRMELQLKYLEENPKCIIVGSNIIEFKSEKNDLNRKRCTPESRQEIIEFAKKRNPFNHMTVVYRREKILKLGGYKHHLYMEDYNLWIRAIAAGYDMHGIQEELVFARVGENLDMIGRRRGINYVKSEYQLFKYILKNNINKPINAFNIFIIRSTSRLLPINFLNFIYKKQRKN